jgi:hypothetical protein
MGLLYLYHSFADSGLYSVSPGVTTAEEVDRVGDKGSADTTIGDLHIILKAFLNMSLILTCSFDEACLLFKSKT